MTDETLPPDDTAAMPAESTSTPEASEGGSVLDGLNIGSETVVAPVRTPTLLRGKVLKDGTVVATGRRKTSVARVRVKRGTGKVEINGREFEEYFPVERARLHVLKPLAACKMEGQVDVWVRVQGGGPSGQAGAILLGIARAVQAMNPEMHSILADGGFLTRDDRMVERKKYGHRKARRSFQFSKR